MSDVTHERRSTSRPRQTLRASSSVTDDALPDDDATFEQDDDVAADDAALPLVAPPLTSTSGPMRLTVDARSHGWRVDHFLSRLYPNYSRALFQRAVEQKEVSVNGLPVKSARKLRVNDVVEFQLPSLPDQSIPPEDIPIEVLYEDDWIVVINKAAGIITHPGRGNYRGTLAGALQFHFNRLSDMAGQLRPGIVHRLDKDTSGVLVVAKDNTVHHRLTAQFEAREVQKEYRAIVWGDVTFDSDWIETHMRPHPQVREKMAVCLPGGNSRVATTFYEVVERYHGFSYVRLKPRTGRTHQLRVHMQHIAHPIVADRVYGGQMELRRSELAASRTPVPGTTASAQNDSGDVLISRQALHAYKLELRHPDSGRPMSFEAPLPFDMSRTLEALRAART